jgi:hypothetical protein
VAAAVAVTIGVLAVTSVGASVRDRGPLGNELQQAEAMEGSATPQPGAARGDSIEIEVYCHQGRPTVADLERKTMPEDD